MIRTGAPFLRLIYQGNALTYPLGSNVAQREMILTEYNNSMQNFHICTWTEKLLKVMLENAIEQTYVTGIYTGTQGFRNRTIQEIFMHLYQTYRRITNI